MAHNFQHIGIIGGGAWGTALAMAVHRAGRGALVWAHEADVAAAINQKHENHVFLPGLRLDGAIRATHNLADLAVCDVLLLVTPAQHARGICRQLAGALQNKPVPVVICAKGMEQKTGRLLSEAVAEEMPGRLLAVLSGPSFAAEVARGLPTALAFATKDKAFGEAMMQSLGGRHFRLYLTDDVVGAQLGGAIKNVLAVACGIAAGCKMGENARAALITRGLAEMIRLGNAMGAQAETLMGLSGLGDLVLTCSSLQSRNMSLGAALGEGKKLSDILGHRASVAEGVYTAAAAKALAVRHNVEMPIVAAVDGVLNNGAGLEATIETLLARPMKAESNAG
ncbi:MAG: NAD(P)H-dependent glycerol-3-phosphate dehydrogenase [Bdellovibrionales bacterium]